MSLSKPKENKVMIDGLIRYGALNQPNLKFFKVNVDCWEKIFDLLSLRDILAISETCQWMQKVAGYYFRENFHGSDCYIIFRKPSNPEILIALRYPIKRNDFLHFVDTVRVHVNLDYLRKASSKNLLGSLTTLHLEGMCLDEHQLHGFENLQTKIKSIKLNCCTIEDNFAGLFLRSCPKLKYLQLFGVDFKSTTAQNSVFQRTYPMLEHLQLRLTKFHEMGILFLERNPNIKYLRIEADDLQNISLDKSTIQLDYLNIDIWRMTDVNDVLNRLKTLHANGFFKKLRVSIKDSTGYFDDESFIREMTSFIPLEVLSMCGPYTTGMCHLTQLKEMHLMGLDSDEINLETIATNLFNLERLWIEGTDDQLLPFLRHSKKLKLFIFSNYYGEFIALDLYNLNRARHMGGNQRKVRIGIDEDQYLATKWNEKNVNYDFVEITRIQTIRAHFFNA